MASARMKNRLYWLTAKSAGTLQGEWVAFAFNAALRGGVTDPEIAAEVADLEARYGAHKPVKDLADETLRAGRQVADRIMREAR